MIWTETHHLLLVNRDLHTSSCTLRLEAHFAEHLVKWNVIYVKLGPKAVPIRHAKII
jgi:hypothetical protein